MSRQTTDPIEELAARIPGGVITPDDERFDEARSIFNSMIDRRPAAIARCATKSDVAAALSVARQAELEVAVRAGGHSVAGAGATEGGLQIDLRPMNQVSVDPDASTVTVGGGASWGEVDPLTMEHGLATTGGRVSTTGVAGLTLGGGSGWLERSLGLACDRLAAVELVTADGETVVADEEQNTELFWALHGGGGNFGVATSLTFDLAPLPEFHVALLVWPGSAGEKVVRRYRDVAGEAPEAFGGGALYITGPPEEFVPAELQGRLVCAVLVTFSGPAEEFEAQIAPLLELDPPGRMIAPVPYEGLQSMLDDPPGFRNYWSAEHLDELPDAAIDAFCARAEEMIVPSPTQHIIFPWGGAVARRSGDFPTANREALWVVHPLCLWEDPDDDQRAIDFSRGVCADMKQWAKGGAYLNFTGDEGHDRIVEGFGGREIYDRLAAVKAEFDPDNVFHLNHNIQPQQAATA